MPCASTERWSATGPPASSTGLPSKPSTISARGVPASYEAFREPRVLGGLRKAARAGPRSRRQEFRPAERKSAASVAATQESRTVLVGARGFTLSRAGNGNRRRSHLVLDWIARRLRRHDRLRRLLFRRVAAATRQRGPPGQARW